MRATLVVVLSVIFMAGLCGMAVAGSIDSPGVPSGGSGMHTIGQLYNYLNSGTDSSIPGSFQGPAGAPGPTVKTLEDVYQDIKAKLGQSTVSAADVKSGEKFFCTLAGRWGVQTGTLVVPPTPTTTPTIAPTMTPTPWTLNSATCSATSGWTWINSACWSQAIADSVSWNKGVGDDTSKTGTYTCNSGGTLKSRMEAAVAGRWSEICTNINGRAITTSDNGDTGKAYISAIAIADCVDGSRDIGETIAGGNWVERSGTLNTWARASGHTAIPAVDYNDGNNEFNAACSGDFYKDTSTLSPGINYCWAAACGNAAGGVYTTHGRILGGESCATTGGYLSSYAGDDISFRVVARP
ncbi:MAG: hypothetical protein NTZ78_07970 [Candidatus Aureabacteria bacterium]|nr:hypothetical protein [Candidatus Auribacterota bacterium]